MWRIRITLMQIRILLPLKSGGSAILVSKEHLLNSDPDAYIVAMVTDPHVRQGKIGSKPKCAI